MFERPRILSAATVWSTLFIGSASAHDSSKYSNDLANAGGHDRAGQVMTCPVSRASPA